MASRLVALPAFPLLPVLSFIEQRGEFIACLVQGVAAESSSWIFAANDHAQNGIAPIQPVAGLAFWPSRSQFSAQQDQAADHIGQIMVDLNGPVLERTVECRYCDAATIRTHRGTLPVKRK